MPPVSLIRLPASFWWVSTVVSARRKKFLMLTVTICCVHSNSTSKPSHWQHWEGARPFPTTVWWGLYSSTTSLSPTPHARARWVIVSQPSGMAPSVQTEASPLSLAWLHMRSEGVESGHLIVCACLTSHGDLTCAARDLKMETCIVHAHLASHVQQGTWERRAVLSMLTLCPVSDLRMQTCIFHARLASHAQQGTWECRPVLSMLAWHHTHSKGLENADLYCPCSLGITRTARDLRMQTCIVHAHLASHAQQETWECRPVLSMLALHHSHSKGLENPGLYCPCSLCIIHTARVLGTQACIVHARFASFTQQGTWKRRPVLSMLTLRHSHIKGLENAGLYCPQELSPSRHQQIRHLLKNVQSGSCVFQCHSNLSV